MCPRQPKQQQLVSAQLCARNWLRTVLAYAMLISISISILFIVLFLSQDVLGSLWSQRGLYCFYQWSDFLLGCYGNEQLCLLSLSLSYGLSYDLCPWLMTYDLQLCLSFRSIFPQSFLILQSRNLKKERSTKFFAQIRTWACSMTSERANC